MPYEVEKDHPDCPASEPYGVVKEDDGTLMGCHPTEDDAHAQIAAIEANEDDDEEERLHMSKYNLPASMHFAVDQPIRQAAEGGGEDLPGRVLVASGTQSRNRDYWTGKTLRLVPSGIRTQYWSKMGNPVLWMHNFNIPPLARGNIFLEDGQLWARDDFDFHRMLLPIATNNWIGDAVGTFDSSVIADLWQQRFLNAVSIHVMCTPEDEENIVETDDEFILPTSEMLEFSIVTMPGDREATREEMLSAGVHPRVAQFLCKDGVCYPNSGANSSQTNTEFVLSAEGDTIYLPSKTGRIVPGTRRYWQVPEMDIGGISIEEIDGLWQLTTVSGSSTTANTHECEDCGEKKSDSPASSGGSRNPMSSVEDTTMSKQFKSLGEDVEAPVVEEPTAANDAPPAEAEDLAAVEDEGVQEVVGEDVEDGEGFEYAELQAPEVEITPVQLAEAIAADAEALLILAQAMFENPRVRQFLMQQVSEQVVPSSFKLKVGAPQGNGTPKRATVAQTVQPQVQTQRGTFKSVERSVPMPQEKQQAQPSHPLARMARNT